MFGMSLGSIMNKCVPVNLTTEIKGANSFKDNDYQLLSRRNWPTPCPCIFSLNGIYRCEPSHKDDSRSQVASLAKSARQCVKNGFQFLKNFSRRLETSGHFPVPAMISTWFQYWNLNKTLWEKKTLEKHHSEQRCPPFVLQTFLQIKSNNMQK